MDKIDRLRQLFGCVCSQGSVPGGIGDNNQTAPILFFYPGYLLISARLDFRVASPFNRLPASSVGSDQQGTLPFSFLDKG
jgi:hypothetical protein